jgi:O-6-methylguanine DNA methyltransferase
MPFRINQSRPRQGGASLLLAGAHSDHLGPIGTAASERGLVAVGFGVSREYFKASLKKRTGLLLLWTQGGGWESAGQIKEYLEGSRRSFSLRIDWSAMASDFQRRALPLVFPVPYGQTRTYGQIANEMSSPRAARAVGGANACNPMPLIIPCHRLVEGARVRVGRDVVTLADPASRNHRRKIPGSSGFNTASTDLRHGG